MTGWYWWAGFNGDVECEASYALGEFATRDEAISAGMAEMPDGDGNSFFHIIEAQFGDDEPGEHNGYADVIPFKATRNHEIIEQQVVA